MIKKFSYMYIFFDVFLIIFSLYMGGFWLLNTQLAFISSMLILFSSFYGYKKAIQAKSSFVKTEDFEDELEDKEIIKKVRKSFNTLSSSLSPFRLLSYIFLILCFLYLNRHSYLNVGAFLLGLGVLPLGSLALGFKKFYKIWFIMV